MVRNLPFRMHEYDVPILLLRTHTYEDSPC
jgi:hypothetical protein